MRRLAPAALLFACACASAPAEQNPAPTGRRHHVVVNRDEIVLDFVEAHGGETFDVLTLNLLRSTYEPQTPLDLAPLARLKSIHTLVLSGFAYRPESRGLQNPAAPVPGLTDRQVEDIGRIRTLRRLELRGCNLSSSQRMRLKSQLPQCEVREN
jgi:hypothetical protein